jgi:hypothetical protein
MEAGGFGIPAPRDFIGSMCPFSSPHGFGAVVLQLSQIRLHCGGYLFAGMFGHYLRSHQDINNGVP